jgi:import inner membrane translocase subunit TIM23
MSSISSGGSNTEKSSSQNPADYLRSASFSRSEAPAGSSDNAVTASDFLMAAYDPAKLHPLADLGDKLDYLLLDDDKKSELPGAGTAMPSRGWSDDLCYGTGTMYLSGMFWISFKLLDSTHCVFASSLVFSPALSPYLNISDDPSLVSLLFSFITCSPFFFEGLAIGGAWGVREGARRPLAVSNTRLRINSILNSVTRRGTFIGNSAGVLGPFSSFPGPLFPS